MNNKELPSDSDQNCFDAARSLLDNPSSILSNIMASMGDGLSIQDLNMRIVYQNKFMIDNFGSHIGDYCYNIYEKRSAPCEGCPIIESYRTGQVTKALRVGITKDGVPFRFENIASVLHDAHGKIIAGMELCRIVEEREKAFDELRKTMDRLKNAQNQLIHAEKMAGIGQLAAGVAHEINNPAAFILCNLSTMQDYVIDFFSYIDSIEKLVKSSVQSDLDIQGIQTEIEYIISSDDYRYLKCDLPKIIEESLDGLQRIKKIVSSLLIFASFNEDKRCIVDMNEEIESVLVLLSNEIIKKGRVAKSLGAISKTIGNTTQLKQMFINLIINAIQAINDDGLISVRTEMKNNYISIEISDNGVGIPGDIIQNIFNPFFSTREVGKGVGLGLSIVYRIVEAHNGNIDVQSETGKGTTFTISFPIISANETP